MSAREQVACMARIPKLRPREGGGGRTRTVITALGGGKRTRTATKALGRWVGKEEEVKR